MQVHLIGHSAGGWLGRAFIADPLYFDSPAAQPGVAHQGIASLVTLGTPHSAPPPEQARDMTGGALTWVNSQWPGERGPWPSLLSMLYRMQWRVMWLKQNSLYTTAGERILSAGIGMWVGS